MHKRRNFFFFSTKITAQILNDKYQLYCIFIPLLTGFENTYAIWTMRRGASRSCSDAASPMLTKQVYSLHYYNRATEFIAYLERVLKL